MNIKFSIEISVIEGDDNSVSATYTPEDERLTVVTRTVNIPSNGNQEELENLIRAMAPIDEWVVLLNEEVINEVREAVDGKVIEMFVDENGNEVGSGTEPVVVNEAVDK